VFDTLIERIDLQMNFNRIKKAVVVCAEAGTGETTALCMHINEAEAQRIKPLMADPNLVVKVAGTL
jgi:hypothetical protein